METEDRLSLLPQPLIDHIFSFLPTKEVIRTTSFLSKKWRQTWKTLPNLHFHITSPQEVQSVNLALSLRFASSPLSKFRLTNSSTDRDLGPGGSAGILSATSGFLRELDVNLGITKFDFFDRLLACSSLVSLKLQARLENPLDLSGSFCLANLRVLHLGSIGYNGGAIVTIVPSNFPLLEDLSLSGSFATLNISVPNLRKLLLIAALFSRIRISCPKLENFSFVSDQHGGWFEGDMPSLTSSTLVVPFSGAIWRHSVVSRILGSASNVLDLNISTCWSGKFEASPEHLLEEPMCLPAFQKLINLRFLSCLHDEHLEALICLLRHSPNLETLLVQQMKCYCTNKADGWKARLLPNKILGCLNSVKIWDMDGSEIANKREFVKFMSINTGVLQELGMYSPHMLALI